MGMDVVLRTPKDKIKNKTRLLVLMDSESPWTQTTVPSPISVRCRAAKGTRVPPRRVAPPARAAHQRRAGASPPPRWMSSLPPLSQNVLDPPPKKKYTIYGTDPGPGVFPSRGKNQSESHGVTTYPIGEDRSE
jgi:hypothetical protein